jgi:hypothetical protein
MILIVFKVLEDLIELEIDLVQCLGQVQGLEDTVTCLIVRNHGHGQIGSILTSIPDWLGFTALYSDIDWFKTNE